MPDLKAARAVIRGQVQGVGFRQAARSRARSLHLWGWVRNERSDGSVEIWLQGDAAKVDQMLDWLWIGPPSAEVSGVESDVVAVDNYLQDFLIRQ